MNLDENLDDFMGTLERGGIRSYFLFETLILKLLIKHLEEQGKPFAIHTRVDGGELDGIASEGVDDLAGPTLVEIKPWRRLSPRVLREVLQKASISYCCWQKFSKHTTRYWQKISGKRKGFYLSTCARLVESDHTTNMGYRRYTTKIYMVQYILMIFSANDTRTRDREDSL